MKRIAIAAIVGMVLCAARVDAAISFVGGCETSSIDGNNATLTLPGGVVQNDLVVVAYSLGDNDNTNENVEVTSPAGYTEAIDLYADDAQELNFGVYWKVQTATPDTSVTVSAGTVGTDGSISAACMVFRGTDPNSPLDVLLSAATGVDTFVPNPPSLIWSGAPGVWTMIAVGSGHSQGGARTYTFPTGYTTDAIDVGSDDTNDTTTGLAYRSSGASNPEDPPTLAHTGTDTVNYVWAAVTIALRPCCVVVEFTDAVLSAGSWTTTGAANASAAVSEALGFPDDDTSYTQTTTTPDGDFLQLYDSGADFSIPGTGNTINSVSIVIRAKWVTGSGDVAVRVFEEGTSWGLTEVTLSSSYAIYTTTYTNNPCSGSAWTEAQVEGTSGSCYFRVGDVGTPGFPLEPRNNTGTVRVTQAYIVVNYTPSGGGGGGGGARQTNMMMGMD